MRDNSGFSIAIDSLSGGGAKISEMCGRKR